MIITKEEFDKRLDDELFKFQDDLFYPYNRLAEGTITEAECVDRMVEARKQSATRIRQLMLDTGNAVIGENNPNIHNIIGIENQNNLREFQRAELREIVKGE